MNQKNPNSYFYFFVAFLCILLIGGLLYRYYVVNDCETDRCLRKRLLFQLDSLDSFLRKLKHKENKLRRKLQTMLDGDDSDEDETEPFSEREKEEDVVEGFLPGLGTFFSGSSSEPVTASTSPVPLNTSNVPLNTSNVLMNTSQDIPKPMGTGMPSSSTVSDKKMSMSFPPTSDFQEADNKDLLNTIRSKSYVGLQKLNASSDGASQDKDVPPQTSLQVDVPTLPKEMGVSGTVFPKRNIVPEIVEPLSNTSKSSSSTKKSLKDSCQFYGDKCPTGYSSLGHFSIGGGLSGVSDGFSFQCGAIQDTKPAKAVAEIRNNQVYQIHVVDQGHGYLPDKPPKITIQGGNGNGATAEPIVDDDGFLKVIQITNGGEYYTDTPSVLIEPPYMNSSCHLCCQDDAL